MLTLYHQDGDALLLTHYCAAGNQPRMICHPGAKPDQFVFEFLDATNMKSLQDHHMHSVTITIIDDHHLRAEWQAYRDGKPLKATRFDLVRKQ